MVKRREFLKGIAGGAGAAIAGFALGSAVTGVGGAEERIFGEKLKKMWEIPTADAYLIVDQEKCGGCRSCMLACSLANQGEENLSLSRIQVLENSFAGFPNDIVPHQCRQCEYPECVAACPTGALQADDLNGNIRVVDEGKCVGCQRCVEACGEVYHTSRVLWNNKSQIAQKCDLCDESPYWDENGGPDGKQACVEVCPFDAIEFTHEVPVQIGDEGYKVNLRDEVWEEIGFSVD